MNRIRSGALFGLLGLLGCAPTSADSFVNGAGATLPQPVISAWSAAYEQQRHLRVTFQGVGSAEGIRRITARSVDFALTDIPLTQSELLNDDLIQFPLVASGIVPVFNLPGLAAREVKLTGEVLANIFLGRVTAWDDPQIQSLNPELHLPAAATLVVHRKDGSGSTFTFTQYLSKVSATWDAGFGIASSLRWPTGDAEQGNDGVAEKVRDTPGALGYVEYQYAVHYRLATVSLRNRDGRYVEANLPAFQAAFEQARWQRRSYYEALTDLPGAESWPLVAVSYVLIHRTQWHADDAIKTIDWLRWVYENGAPFARDAGYIIVHANPLVSRIEESWRQLEDRSGRAIYK
jgi:phosphate transport system substrate-binding protein